MKNTRMSCNYVVAFLFVFFSYFTGTAANYLCITANEDYVKISYSSADEEHKPDVRYSYDGTNWIEWTEPISLMQDEKLYVKGDNPDGFSFSDKSFTQFSISKSATVSGSVMSLIDGEGESTVIPNEYCFYSLFKGCEVTTAPELPATTLKAYCYASMFENCHSLKIAPALPATEMEPNCYRLMFWSCSFSEAPELPAKKLAKSCYSGMFGMCMSLEETPLLPATDLADSCYSGMFTLCSSLRKVVYLPAETFANGCYSEMFQICTSLNYVKVGCISLDYNGSNGATSNWMSYVEGVKDGVFIFPCGSDYDKRGASAVPVDFTIINSPVVVFQNPDGTVLRADTIACGETPNYGDIDPVLDDEHQFVKWNKELTPLTEPDIYYYIAEYKKVETPAPGNWLCFAANENGSYIGYENNGANSPHIQYSIDEGISWSTLSPNERVTLEKEGDRVFIKGSNPKGFSFNDDDYTTFYMGGSVAASGSVMSLVDGEGTSTKIPNSNCFRCLFKDCSALTRAPELPATELTSSCYSLMFSGCSNLLDAPKLPAIELASSCYYYMFNGCVSMKEAPALPATQLASACYFCMFIRCESFTKAPELPATELMKHCYQGMFQECINLTEAPVLPATQMEQDCYTDMFHGCKSLVKAPALPAEELADGCYHSMFFECTSLTEAPQLPAMELKKQCYRKMFSGCTSLTTAPELPSESLVESCYNEMFKGCTQLNYIKVGVMSLDNEVGATENWVSGINGKGEFVFPCGTKYNKHGVSEVSYNFTIIGHAIVIFQYSDDEELWRDTVSCGVVPEYNGPAPEEPEELEFIGWNKTLTEITKPGEYRYTALYRQQAPSNWLCFTAEETNSTFYLDNNGANPNVEYSLDGGNTWMPMKDDEIVMLSEVGEKAYLRGNNPDGFSHDLSSYSQFIMSGSIAASGSVMSLIDERGVSKNIPNDYCFLNLFKYCRSLTKAPELPATTLSSSCYQGMFDGCSELTVAPELPATHLANDCYSGMFAACENLTATPDLPATELASSCYASMFAYCRNLTNAPDVLPATVMYDHCYASMFFECVSLSNAPELPAEKLAKYCYNFMFQGCTSLTTAPELPAETMADACYQCMFQGCTSLSQAPKLISTELAQLCYSNMFGSCVNLKEAPELPASDLKYSCYLDMFRGCTSLEKAPELLADKLVDGCYNGMFYGCENLNYIKVGVLSLDMTSDMTLSPTEDWVYGIEGEGEFIFPCGSKYNKHGKSEVPTNFTITGSPIIVFQNLDGRELWRDTISCDVIPEYGGDIPTMGAGYAFRGWDKELTQIKIPDVYYYTAVYDEIVDPLANKWLCFTAEEDDAVVWYSVTGEINPDVQYSLDEGKTWSPLTNRQEITLKEAGEKVYIKGYNPEGFNTEDSYVQFGANRNVSVSGSVMSLIDGVGAVTEIPNPYCFYRLFYQNLHLTAAPELSATVLTEGCYRQMFAYCEELTEAPVLPAVTMAERCYQDMFQHCMKLTKAPTLPAEEMERECYYGMFRDCYSLAEAPALPATTLADSCYCAMFDGCSSLTKTPDLTATDMAVAAYMYMFTNCTSLTEVTSLPATHLERNCYTGMFSGCSSLVEAPALPATTLADSCYTVMFAGCRNMKTPPELPAKDLARSCYEYMFTACASIVEAPVLPATILKPFCYAGMFAGCTYLERVPEIAMTTFAEQSCFIMFNGCYNLNYIKVGANTLDNEYDATRSWVVAIKNPGVFVFPCGSKYDKHGDSEVPVNFEIQSSPIVVFQNPDGRELYRDTIACDVIPEYIGDEPTYGEGMVFVGWDKPLTVLTDLNTYYFTAVYEEEQPVSGNWLCFTAEKAESEVWYKNNTFEEGPDVQYSLDGGRTWNPLAPNEHIVLKSENDKVYFKGNNPDGFSRSEDGEVLSRSTTFRMSGSIAASGSVMSLVDGEGTSTVIPNDFCFASLFEGCLSLTKAPELPATTLTRGCYEEMFRFCDDLVYAPELPALQMAEECYVAMFAGCVKLTKAPALPAKTLATRCYYGMFADCYYLVDVPELPATNLAEACYGYMFRGCTSLTDAPVLPATVMATSCYTMMFKDCYALVEAPELPATTLEDDCYSSMFSDCSHLEKAPVLPAEVLSTFCYEEMFARCKRLTTAPELPAKELKSSCYQNMFNGCTNLNYIKVGVMSLDNDDEATLDWVKGIDGEGVFIFPCGSKYDKHGVSEVPENFKIISSPVVVFQNPDGEELYRDTIGCDVVAEYRGETPTYGDGLVFKGWDPELTIHPEPDTFYYTAVYEEELTPITDVSRCLCFTAAEKGSEVWYQNHGNNAPDIQYSVDEGRTWIPLAADEHVVLNSVDDKVYFKGINPEGFSHGDSDCTFFEMSGMIAASGSVMSLLDGEGVSNVIPNEFCFHFLFGGCASLTKAPELPATTLSKACYMGMFSRCSRLTDMPELPATTLADSCYSDMFSECSKLIKTTELPATTLTEGCYESMFYKCISLTDAPELPATTLAKGCYNSMFCNCTSLTEAPELPATTLAVGCYNGMFYGCSSLTKAPELPATTLMDGCYCDMFNGCTSLTEAPELPAAELVNECYNSMFRGCSNLTYIKVGVMTLDGFGATSYWVYDVKKEGTFIFPCGSKYDKHGVSVVPVNFKIISSPVVIFQNPDGEELYRDTIACDVVAEYKGETPTYGEGLVFKGWDKELTVHPDPDTFYYTAVYEEGHAPITDVSKCLCFTAEEAGSEVMCSSSSYNPDIQYSIDGGRTWHVLSKGEKVLLANVGDKVYFRGNNPNGLSSMEENTTSFGMNGSIAASGSVMSLIDGVGESKVIPNDGCFIGLFQGCSSLTQAPELPATTLTKLCYYNMFTDCVNLTKAPELPALTLEESCYSLMFWRCTGLTSVSELPATTLAEECYSSMFNGCASLTDIPELPATTLAKGCYSSMFSSCTSLTQASALPATTLAEGCYSSMFYYCKSLTDIPELPATTLAKGCYGSMFSYCTSLTQAPELPATTLAEGCYSSMFSGCTSLTTAPELPATELVENCYGRMFYGCENLNYIKVGVMSLDNNFEYGSTDSWVSGVDGPGVFIFPCGSTYDKHGVSEVPDNFDILRGIVTVIFQNPDSTVLWKETINCNEVPEYKGETPTMGEDYFFIGWDKELTAVGDESVYYITAVYEDLNKYESLHLTVDDALYLVLPGGSETIGYELLEGGGSRYEIWYNGEIITEGAVTNDSTIQLICPEEFALGSYTATLVMYDERNGRGESDFVFHVMMKDDPTNSYYVKVWNDVVICRNGDNKFVSYQWYKNRKIVEGATLQYYSDVELLDGEYLIYVTDQSGKSYFIEPKQFERVEASYSIAAEPSIVNRGTDFTVVVSGVEPEHLKNARIVVYRNDGVVVNILDDVETENEMHLAAIGDYVIVLTVNDGKNANCKVLIK